jgi:hypothetical protein
MMNLEILWVVYGLTGNATLRNIAITHADTTMKNHIRTDGSFTLILTSDFAFKQF